MIVLAYVALYLTIGIAATAIMLKRRWWVFDWGIPRDVDIIAGVVAWLPLGAAAVVGLLVSVLVWLVESIARRLP